MTGFDPLEQFRNTVSRLQILADSYESFVKIVGMTGFEPATFCSQSRRATSCATSR